MLKLSADAIDGVTLRGRGGGSTCAVPRARHGAPFSLARVASPSAAMRPALAGPSATPAPRPIPAQIGVGGRSSPPELDRTLLRGCRMSARNARRLSRSRLRGHGATLGRGRERVPEAEGTAGTRERPPESPRRSDPPAPPIRLELGHARCVSPEATQGTT
jgi:hypothetical protein